MPRFLLFGLRPGTSPRRPVGPRCNGPWHYICLCTSAAALPPRGDNLLTVCAYLVILPSILSPPFPTFLITPSTPLPPFFCLSTRFCSGSSLLEPVYLPRPHALLLLNTRSLIDTYLSTLFPVSRLLTCSISPLIARQRLVSSFVHLRQESPSTTVQPRDSPSSVTTCHRTDRSKFASLTTPTTRTSTLFLPFVSLPSTL